MPKQVIPARIEAKITLIISQTLPGFQMWSQCQKRTYAINLLCSFAGSDILLRVSVLSSTISPWCYWHHGGSWARVLRAAVLRTDNLVLSSLKAAWTLSLRSEGTGHKPCFISMKFVSMKLIVPSAEITVQDLSPPSRAEIGHSTSFFSFQRISCGSICCRKSTGTIPFAAVL